ncbi:MAG: ATP-binding protein, partial [Cyanobacteria bacterium]|nr:ATP-binding protein [Cyanobacteriota bacterium]
MSLNTSLYDSATVEMFLMEDLPLEGRKADLKLLMKHLHSAKSGLMKTVLLTGEPGIGKSALLSAFANIAQKGHSSFVLDLRSSHLTSYEKFFIAFAEKSIEASSQILENALQQILESTPTLNLQWTRDDLLEALAILEVNGLSHPDERHKAKLQEQLLRKFRKSAHPIQPFKPSSTAQDEMEKLITILMNPAITIAKSFIRPTQPQIQKVFKIAQFLRQEHFSDTSPLAKALSNIISETEASENLYESYLSSSTQSKNIARNRLIQDHEQRSQASEFNPQESIAAEKSTTKRSLADLALQLNKVLKYIDYLLGTMDAAFVILIDDWDEIVDIPETTREDLKAFLIELFRDSSDQKNLKVMLCLSARSSGESYSLGGSFYNIFQNKILLSGLTDGDRDALLLAPLTQANIEVDASILSKIYNLTKGNPFWLLKAQQFLKNWAESIEVSH